MRRPQRLLITALMLWAFLLQSYATQTHIHPAPMTAAFTVVDKDSGQAENKTPGGAKKNAPSPVNPDNCPLCQFFYAGQYVAPGALLFFLPTVSVSTIEILAGLLPHYDAVSHSWRGRAPPSA